MRAVCLLLCLAIARDCAGSIIRKQHIAHRVNELGALGVGLDIATKQLEANELGLLHIGKEGKHKMLERPLEKELLAGQLVGKDASNKLHKQKFEKDLLAGQLVGADASNKLHKQKFDKDLLAGQMGKDVSHKMHKHILEKDLLGAQIGQDAIHRLQGQSSEERPSPSQMAENAMNRLRGQSSEDGKSPAQMAMNAMNRLRGESNEDRPSPAQVAKHAINKLRGQSNEEKESPLQSAKDTLRKFHQKRNSLGYMYDSQSSEESKNDEIQYGDRRKKDSDHEFPEPLHADSVNYNSPLFVATVNPEIDDGSFGDLIVWRGIAMADGPNSLVNDKKDIEKLYKDADRCSEHLSEKEKEQFHQTYQTAAQGNNEDASLNATQLLQKNDYQVETHTVLTLDGYSLTLFRIPPKKKTDKVVLLMHGFLGSADDWLLLGPGKSLAYLLADAGYDVWLGNVRGNKYCRQHVSKHPAQPDFWQYSNDDIALYDLPSIIDYVLKNSNKSKLYYVGIDLGTTIFLALASARPEYNSKIAMMYALSPMAYLSNSRSPLLRMMNPASPFYNLLEEYLGDGEFNPSEAVIASIGGALCEKEFGCKEVCSNLYFATSGPNVKNMDVSLLPVILGHLPAGSSVKQLRQYAQAAASGEFRMYDYGSEINQQVYGSPQPTRYDLAKVSVAVALYYSDSDLLAHQNDVSNLESKLKNVKVSYKIPQKYFSHMDFQFSKQAPELNKQLVKSIQEQQ